MTLKYGLMILFATFGFSLFAKKTRTLNTADKRALAVVKIQIFDKNLKKISAGTGFFIGRQGLILTSKHNLKPFFFKPGTKLYLANHAQKTLKKVELFQCDSENNIDLCLLKAVDHVPQYFFPMESSWLGKGYGVKLTGFCNSEKPVLKAGKMLDVYEKIDNKFGRYSKNVGVQMYRTSIKQCPGDSGGPIYSDDGLLHGVATINFTSKATGQEYFLSISGLEAIKAVEKFQTKSKSLINPRRVLQLSPKRLRIEKLLK